MNNNPIFNPFDEDEQKVKENNAPIGIDQSSTFSPMEQEQSGGKTVRLILLISGIAGCCIVAILAYVFFQPAAPPLIGRLFPSPTATITRTPTRTPTPNLTATQRAIQSTSTALAIQTTIADAGVQWDILHSDTFDSNKNQWATKTDDDYATILRIIEDGKYQWDATAKQGFIEWIGVNTISVGDFFMTVEAQRTGGTLSSDYGVIFREDTKNNFYYFGVDSAGFHVSLNYDNEWVDIVEWATSDAIRVDRPNRLTVIAEGSHFIFMINDQVVAEADDDHISKGTTGLAVQIFDADLQATFEFDNSEIRIPATPVTVTTTPNLTATSIAEEWKVILADDFDSNQNGWRTESSDTESATSVITVVDGTYSWDITSHKLIINWETANTKPLDDFAMSVDARQIGGPDSAEYGVIFRQSPDYDFYFLGINTKGEYFLDLYYEEWISLISHTKSSLIRPDEYNRITVLAEGSHFTFFINDQYLAEYTDDRIETGTVGLISLLSRSGQQAVFEFDNFELRTP